jgi:hypothetical protein
LQAGLFNVVYEACVWTTQGMLWESMNKVGLRGLHQSNLVWSVEIVELPLIPRKQKQSTFHSYRS